MDGSLGALVLRCRTRNYTSLVVMGSSKRKLCFRYCEIGDFVAGEGAALRGSGRLKDSWAWRCRAGLSRDHAIRTQDRTPSEWGARTVNAGRPSRAWRDQRWSADATRRTMARAVPVAPVGAVLQWERCSSGSGALVGAMLQRERCSGGSDAPVGAVGGATTRSSSAPPEHGTARRRSVGRGIVAAVMQVAST